MLKKTLRAFCFVAFALALYSCNPDCETTPSNNIILPPPPYQAGTELVISSPQPAFLEDREFTLRMSGVNGVTMEPLPARFEERLGAVVVTLPQQLSSSVSFLIDDPDCTGQMLPVGQDASLVGESFFVDNPNFITPTPPLVIIPFPPPSIPPAIIEAWFSPTNRDYCIWFKPADGPNGEELPNIVPAIADGPHDLVPGSGPVPDRAGSAELSANCTNDPIDRKRRLYHNNPVAGIVDKDKNFIQIQIDRTAKGLGVEEFVGEFVDPSLLPDRTYREGGACNGDGSGKPNIMFLTSLKTGRQLILFRGAD